MCIAVIMQFPQCGMNKGILCHLFYSVDTMHSLHRSTWNQSWLSASKTQPHGWSAPTIGGGCRGSNPAIAELLLAPQAAANFWTKTAGSRDAAVKTESVVEVARDLHSLWENEIIHRDFFVLLLSVCSSDSIRHILSRFWGPLWGKVALMLPWA